MDTKLRLKNKYPNKKFIDFKRPGTSIEASCAPDIIEIKEFYTELVNDNNKEVVPNHNDNDNDDVIFISTTKSTIKNEAPQVSCKEYLSAAQNNNLKIVSQFIESNSLQINVKDSFGWNALMIAIASSKKSNRVVEFLFKQTDNPLFEELLNSKDSAGNSPLTIANQVANKVAIELIATFNQEKDLTREIENNSSIIDISLVNDEEEQVKYCEDCKIEYNTAEHLNSISHLLNSTSNNDSESKRFSYNYHIRKENKGYQLLCKSGWTNKKGLGKFEQGVVCPIKAKQKLDRYGIGASSNQTEYKTNNSRLESQLKYFKNSNKKLRKDKERERNLRTYFNS